MTTDVTTNKLPLSNAWEWHEQVVYLTMKNNPRKCTPSPSGRGLTTPMSTQGQGGRNISPVVGRWLSGVGVLKRNGGYDWGRNAKQIELIIEKGGKKGEDISDQVLM